MTLINAILSIVCVPGKVLIDQPFKRKLKWRPTLKFEMNNVGLKSDSVLIETGPVLVDLLSITVN